MTRHSTFECQECDKGFRNNHLNIVHKKAPVITCTECCVSFLTQFQLNKHKQSKHSNLIFNCQSCDKSFTSNASLKAHVTRHRSGPGVAMVNITCPRPAVRAGVIK